MRNACRALLSLVLVLACTAGALADSKVALTAKAGTLGFGVEATGNLTDRINLRGGFNGFSVSDEIDEADIEYDGELDWGSVGVLVDFHPTKGSFRVSGGLFSVSNEIGLAAMPTAPIEIGGVVYDPGEVGVLNGKLDFGGTAPYAGIGFGNATKKRIGFSFDLGVLLQGSPNVTLTATSTLVDPVDLETERLELEDDASGFDVWPVISFGVSFGL